MIATDTQALAAAIVEFETALPGWWWSLGSCSVSRDASCGPRASGGPDLNCCDADLLKDRLFDDGFHCDDREGTVAGSLRIVMEAALAARAAARTRP